MKPAQLLRAAHRSLALALALLLALDTTAAARWFRSCEPACGPVACECPPVACGPVVCEPTACEPTCQPDMVVSDCGGCESGCGEAVMTETVEQAPAMEPTPAAPAPMVDAFGSGSFRSDTPVEEPAPAADEWTAFPAQPEPVPPQPVTPAPMAEPIAPPVEQAVAEEAPSDWGPAEPLDAPPVIEDEPMDDLFVDEAPVEEPMDEPIADEPDLFDEVAETPADPMPAEEMQADDLFADEAPADAADEGDLFGNDSFDAVEEPAEEMAFGEEPADDAFGDDAFGDEPADDLFAEEPADDGAFFDEAPAEEAMPADEGDLFGEESPADDGDLFGADEPAADEGDLFGDDFAEGAPAEEVMPAEEGDLFDAAADESDLFNDAADEGDLFDAAPADEMPADEGGLFDDMPAEEAPAGDEGDDAFDDLFGGFGAILTEPGGLESVASRTWVDNSGRFSCVGRLLAIDAGTVRLAKPDGSVATVPFSRLSGRDVEFVSRQAIARIDAQEAMIAAERDEDAAPVADNADELPLRTASR